MLTLKIRGIINTILLTPAIILTYIYLRTSKNLFEQQLADTQHTPPLHPAYIPMGYCCATLTTLALINDSELTSQLYTHLSMGKPTQKCES
jgi:hypothetical protein